MAGAVPLHAYPNTYTQLYSNSYSHCNGYGNANCHTHIDTDGYGYPDSDFLANPDRFAHRDARTHPEFASRQHFNPDAGRGGR